MKKIWNTLFFVFFVFCLFLFKPREDIVFGAINKSQYIRLFEKGNDFELCIKDNNTFTGTYLISKDTVFLSYREHSGLSPNHTNSNQSDFRKNLPRKLYINQSASNIKATDGNSFSAEIYLDMRQKPYSVTPYKLRALNSQTTNISVIGLPR